MDFLLVAYYNLYMPSQILHTLFGEDVITGIYRRMTPRFGIVAGKALEKITVHKKAFALGCQGPDLFYHSQGRRPVGVEYGTLLHRRGAGNFSAGLLKLGLPDPPPNEGDIREQRREKGINALGVYALGYMTHALLDRTVHPYIVYKSARPASETSGNDRSHAFFERIIDVLMLKRLRGTEVADWDQDGILAKTCENPPSGLRELLEHVLVLAYPERAGRDEKLRRRIENTFLDCAFFYRITSPAYTSLKRGTVPVKHEEPLRKSHVAYLFPEELPGCYDFLNLENRPWFHPAGEETDEQTPDTRSFPEIYNEAVDAAANTLTPVIARYLVEGFFPIHEASRAIGNGGLSVVDRNGNPCAPRRFDPLPLREVLEQQARLRGAE